ncbi:hypothetical protein SDC9_84027 [bioreactor metagenome]|uniref:Peptidase M56 domain-containing protein n=1 Tax=bioreactor metagenome TaxID=1076179 RepID=A0A644ZFC8_9ZZZZ|nr:M56 family metallopeptidase [Oscillospiraceae bacterium]
MIKIFLEILSVSCSVTLLIVLFAAANILFGNRYTQSCKYIALTLLSLRLAVPVKVFPILPTIFKINIPVMSSSEAGAFIGTAADNVTVFSSDVEKTLYIISVVWAAGALLHFLLLVIPYLHFFFYIKKNRLPIEDERREKLSLLCRKAGIVREPAFYSCPGVFVPMLCGFISQFIILPDDAEEAVIFHELTHYKRKDTLVKLICAVSFSLHWFNPFVSLMIKRLERLAELSCDEAVTIDLSPLQKVEYGRSILEAMRQISTHTDKLVTALSSAQRALRERIELIVSQKSRKKQGTWIIVVAIMFTMSAGMIFSYKLSEVNEPAQLSEALPDTYSYDIADVDYVCLPGYFIPAFSIYSSEAEAHSVSHGITDKNGRQDTD